MNRLSTLAPSTLAACAAGAPAIVAVTLHALGVGGASLIGLIALTAIGGAIVGGRAARAGRRHLLRPIRAAGRDLDLPHPDPVEIVDRLRRELADLRGAVALADDRLAQRSALIEALADPILALSAEGRVLIANAAACGFARLDRSRLVGSGIEEVIAQAPILAAAREALEGRESRRRVDLATRAGPRVFDLSARPVRLAEAAGADGALLILRDVTDLARAARMKTDFVANASHELRTPLAAIRASLDTALAAADDDPALLKRFIGLAPAHLHRLEDLTRDLIDLSRLENPEPVKRVEPLPPADLADSLRALHEDSAAARGVTLEFDLDPALAGFRTDPRLLHLILKNLIDNAIKFCHEGTTVHIAASAPASRGEPGPRWARFEVRDRGVGIPLNQQQRVFERFYQVDQARPGGRSPKRGTGLGLSIVKHAAGALGGEVGIESVYGEGTTVWIDIPELTREPG